MQVDQTQPDSSLSRKKWIFVLCVFLVLFAIFWSVDSSIFYLLLSGAGFSFYKIIQLRPARVFHEPEDVPDEPIGRYTSEPDSQETGKSESFLSSLTQQQRKTLLVLVLGLTSFVSFFIFVGWLVDMINSAAGSSIEYQLRAANYYYNQQYDSSAYYYRLAIQGDPENADLWFERGNSFLNAPDADSALVMYRKALELKPGFEQAQYNIGYIHYTRKNYRESIDETRKILLYNPDYTDAKLLIGDSFYNQSQLDSALNWYEEAYQSGYKSAVLCHLMAYIYDAKGQMPVAINLYKEALGQDSTITEIYVRLGELVRGDEGEFFRKKAAYLNAQQTP